MLPVEEVVQGSVIIYEDRFPRIYELEDRTKVKATLGMDAYIYDTKRRPAIVISKGTDVYKNRLIIPLSSRNNPNTTQIPLLDWTNERTNESSFAKLNDIKTIQDEDFVRVIGKLSDDDLARVMFNVYKMI